MKNILLILVLSVFSLSYAQNKNTKKMEKQVYIVHGYGATPDNHWFKWLEEELIKLIVLQCLLLIIQTLMIG